MKGMNMAFLFIMVLLATSLTSAYTIHVRPTNGTSLLANSTFIYDLNFTTSSDCTGSIYNHSEIITTDTRGEGLLNVTTSSFSSRPSYVCQYRNGTLISVHEYDDAFFRDIFVDDLIADGNITADWINANLSTDYLQTNSTHFENSGGLLTISYSWLTTFIQSIIGDYSFFNNIANFTGTLTNGKICTYNSTLGGIDCNYDDLTGDGENKTHLSNFTDDLGDRGFNNNLNFSNGANYWNDTYATFNKTYADTLYADISVVDTDTNETARFDNLTNLDCTSGEVVIGVQANGTVLCVVDDTGSSGDSSKNASGPYLYNDTTTIYLNETYLNLTIDSRDNDTTYTVGSNLTLTGTTFSLNVTGVKQWLDTIYQAIGNYLTTATTFGGEVSGTYDSIVLDNDALDDQYYDSEGDLTTLLDNNYEPISAHFDASTTANITCFNPECTFYINATSGCQVWSNGAQTCTA